LSLPEPKVCNGPILTQRILLSSGICCCGNW
jgi:hypothetical protein